MVSFVEPRASETRRGAGFAGRSFNLVEPTVHYAVIPGNDPESSPACHSEAVKALTQGAAGMPAPRRYRKGLLLKPWILDFLSRRLVTAKFGERRRKLGGRR